MTIDLFQVSHIEIEENFFINLLLEKDMNLRELIYCYLQIEVLLGSDRKFQKTKKIRFVNNDKLINFDRLMTIIQNLLKSTITIIDSLNAGINLTKEFYLEIPGLDNTPVEIRKELKKSIENITEYKLQPFIIKLYTILTSYKGTDTLQKRKYKKMIEAQEEAMNYQRGY